MTITAYPVNLFGLRDLLLPAGPGQAGQVSPPDRVISLSGLVNTPEWLACAQWQDFLAGYDTDRAILDQIGNGPTGLSSRYDLYLVYTQEMADALEEIIARHGLVLHSQMASPLTRETLESLVGEFLGEGNDIYDSAYLYEDGTFACEGDYTAPGGAELGYQFRRSVRGSFNDVLLNIGDPAQYAQWTYTASDGTPLLLALGPSKGLVVADLEDCFVTVNVLSGSGQGITAAALEGLADAFRFGVLSPVSAPDLSQVQTGIDPEEDPLWQSTGITGAQARSFLNRFLGLVHEGDRQGVAELFRYPLSVTGPEGTASVTLQEELLPWYDTVIGSCADELARAIEDNPLFAADGMICAGSGAVWLASDQQGELHLVTVQNSAGGAIRPLSPGIIADPPAQEASARACYQRVLRDLLERQVYPDGTLCDCAGLGEMSQNSFAILDLDGDGAEELIFSFTTSYIAGQAETVYGYDPEGDQVYVKFSAFPMVTYFDNGYLKAGWSHNQGNAGDALWPYDLYRYDGDSGSWQRLGGVDVWSRDYAPQGFPAQADTDGAGVVYYVLDDPQPVSRSAYQAWYDSVLGEAQEVEIPYEPLTEENIAALFP